MAEAARVASCRVANVGEFQLEVQRRNDRYISTALIEDGVWERFETEVVRRLVDPGSLFVDGGANLGWYTVVAARLGARVLAFEPDVENFRLLKANVARNQVDGATCFLAGLADGAHAARLTLSEENTGDFRIDSSEAGPTVDAVVLPLDDAVGPLDTIGFLKLDTQGSEVRILRGAERALERSRGQLAAIVEFWPYGLSTCGSSHHELADVLARSSGHLFEIDAANERLVPRSTEELHALGDAGVYSVGGRGHTNLLLVPAQKLERVRDLVEGGIVPARASVGLDASPTVVHFAGASQQLAGLASCERRRWSQNGEDGVVAELVRRLSPRRFAVEIGAGDGSECNTRRLRETGWDVVMLDAKTGAGDEISRAMVTAENVNELLAAHGVPGDLGLLSIDIDGNDLWILLALDERYRPAILVTEYNATLGPSDPLVVPYVPDRVWDETNHFGASLDAIAIVAHAKGYSLVYCESAGVNAFFVRTDMLPAAGLVAAGVTDAYRPPRYGSMDAVGGYRGHRFSGRPFWRVDSYERARRRYEASRSTWWGRVRRDVGDRAVRLRARLHGLVGAVPRRES